jgi:NAD(P)-dependent dehydrogenase (short-subunit alcohol dehydrogenase family)
MFDTDIKNQVFLITGANGQLGIALCQTIINLGGKIAGLDLDFKQIKKIALKEKWSINDYMFLKTDITNQKLLKESFNLILKQYKKIDFLINNAAVSIFSNWQNRLDKDLDLVTDVNIKGTLNCIKFFAKFLKNTKKFGAIVNVASHYGMVTPDPRIYTDCKRRNSEIYGATKAAIIQVTKYFATNSSYDGVNLRINAVAPGGILNEKKPQGKIFQKNYSYRTPLNRMAYPNEIVWPILFLLSKKASYINGHTLVIDGGYTAW